jgi:hypothetical protein
MVAASGGPQWCGSPYRMTTRLPGRILNLHILAICDNLAKYVGILRQPCKERKKKWGMCRRLSWPCIDAMDIQVAARRDFPLLD